MAYRQVHAKLNFSPSYYSLSRANGIFIDLTKFVFSQEDHKIILNVICIPNYKHYGKKEIIFKSGCANQWR